MSDQQYILGTWYNVSCGYDDVTGQRIITGSVADDGSCRSGSIHSVVWLPTTWLPGTVNKHALQPGIWL